MRTDRAKAAGIGATVALVVIALGTPSLRPAYAGRLWRSAGSLDWVLGSRAFSYLSGAGQQVALARARVALPLPALGDTAPSARRAEKAGGEDVRVNEPGTDETLPNCNTQNEVHLAAHGDRLAAGWNDGGRCEYLVAPTGNSLSGYGWSDDGGKTWTDGGNIEPAEGGNVWGDPVLAADAGGTFYYATLADSPPPLRSIIGVARSTDGGKTWSDPVDASPARSPSNAQDKEWLAVDATRSRYAGNVYVAWVEFRPSAAAILFSRSTDGAKTFEAPVVELQAIDYEDPETGEFAYVQGPQVAVGPRGEVYLTWLGLADGEDGEAARTELRFSMSRDGGKSFSEPRTIAELARIGHKAVCSLTPIIGGTRDALKGDIRVLNWPSLAVDHSATSRRGTVYIAVANRIADEDESDVFVMSSRNGGKRWSGLVKVNDDDTVNDNFHAQIAVNADGTAAVSWYDRRLDEDNLAIDLFTSSSRDGGRSWSENSRVTDVSFPPAQTNPNSNVLASCYMGEYNGMVADENGDFLVDWGDNRDSTLTLPDPNVYFDRIAAR